ncbi:MAG TPA: Do family serine endopeptidase, partial [Pararhizobium sp.]|nr:Do family serine endopeptidase [Pararhizobium sp.]
MAHPPAKMVQDPPPGSPGSQTPPGAPGAPLDDFFRDFFGEKGAPGNSGSPRAASLGSGFIIDPAGLIVTNNHVIANAEQVTVTFSDDTTLQAQIIGRDAVTDLALLKVNAKGPLPAATWGDSAQARVGDWVLAIGNPFGLGGSVTIGIISARGRNINAGPYDNFIQTDAAINRGNSGGPLFDMEGKVIGINTAIISPTGGSIGIGFSIPSDLAKNVIDQIHKYGEARRGWLGVRIQPVTDDIAESLHMDKAHGALVAGIIKGGPVDNGSIQPGDVIVKFDGKPIDEMHDLPRIVAESPIGKAIDVVVIRKGKEQDVKVELGLLKDNDKLASTGENKPGGTAPGGKALAPQKMETLGMTLGKLDDATRKTFGIAKDVEGVVVTAVAPNSAAAEKRITAGDVIVEVAQEQVSSPKDVIDQVAALKGNGRRNALLMLADKNGELRFLTVRMD